MTKIAEGIYTNLSFQEVADLVAPEWAPYWNEIEEKWEI